jgi:hypothetical protein
MQKNYQGAEYSEQYDGSKLVEESSRRHKISGIDDDRWKYQQKESSRLQLMI